MGIESLPSKNAALLDVPDLEGFQAEFQYNYWTVDEFENGRGSSLASLRQLPSETFESSTVSRTRKLPRLVKLSWKPILLNNDDLVKISIKEHLEKVHAEESFTSNDYTNLIFQDNGLDLKLKFFINQFAANLPEFDAAQSANELIDLVNHHTGDEVKATFLASIISDLSRQGVSFHDKSSLVKSVIDRVKTVAISTRMNNRFLTPVINVVRQDSLGIFADELTADIFTKKIEQIENSAIANASSNLLSSLDYDFEVLSYVSYRPLDTNGYSPVVRSVGYIIEKKEVKSDGSEEILSPIIIDSTRTSITYDGQVKYGSSYFYKARAVYLVEVRAIDETTKQSLLVSFLVGSKFSPELSIATIEMVPPPPPADFNLAWDFGLQGLRCTWNLPPNPQQDIKYIQLFRRRSIADPFQLIRMWDFNDTNTKVPLSEYPFPELVSKSSSFIGFYLDKEFSKDSTYIYATATIDAHGLTSNYSMQFQVSFDRYANKLLKKMISISGAPKQYPNAYLNADTFVDTIKDSGHTNMKIVFNPEYLQLFDANGADLGLLKTNRENGKYRVQLINIDLQSQQSVDIEIEDFRPTHQARRNIQDIRGIKK